MRNCVIEADFIMAKYLQECDYLTLRNLNELSRNIQEQLHSVYLDISRNSVFSAIEYNPYLFVWDNDRVIRAKNSEKLYGSDFTDNLIIEPIPDDIAKKIKEIISEYIKANR